MASPSDLETIIKSNLPLDEVPLIFGYGSQVIKQNGPELRDSLIDIIVVADNPNSWHAENLKRNKNHYSFVRHFPQSISKICQIQEGYGAKVYFNPYVRLGSLMVKYGVIKTEHLVRDLTDWDKLYIAGRLHKPVEFVVNKCDKKEILRSALRFNKESAIRAALLQLPETFDLLRLHKTIIGLSYHGDLRMIFGEDKDKIDSIATSQIARFNELYLPALKFNQHFKETVHWNEGKQLFTQDMSHKTIFKALRMLPCEVRNAICLIHGKQARTIETDVVLASASRSLSCDRIVGGAIASIVRRSSTSQSFKGIITAGIIRSLRYSQRKLLKSLTSRLNFT